MKRSNWENKDHPRELFLAKLSEEFGEVGKAHIEYLVADDPDMLKRANKHMIEELKHVEFIAKNFRRKLEREWIKYHKQ